MKLPGFLGGSPPPAPLAAKNAGETLFTEVSPGEIEREYIRILTAQLARLGVPEQSVGLDIQRVGSGPKGVYLLMIRLQAWDPAATPRLLLALPLLEAKVKKAIQATWLHEAANFGGVWIHASSAVQSTETLKEIQRCVVELDVARASSFNSGAPQSWSASVPAPLGTQ